jgi:signal-transduction protein with cAMP-binding, CBS, and nucleotidyltransferase domain
MSLTKYLYAALAAGLAATVIVAGVSNAANKKDLPMKQSVTYLHLLTKTPFFTSLDKAQLKWVIAHSTEWEVQPGTEISNQQNANLYMWVLLDGGWQVEQGGQVLKAGHADAAKWYGGVRPELLPADSRLVVTEHSYVMRIARPDFDEMLSKKFDFSRHLIQGTAFYTEKK